MCVASRALSLTMLALGLGCSTLTPATFRAKAPDVAPGLRGPVSVTPVHSERPASRFNANGMLFEANLDRFSEQLAGLVAESLEKSGTALGAGGGSLEIQVVYLDFMFQGPCIVDSTVRLGNGAVFGLQATGASKLYDRACARALEAAVRQILGDPRTTAYLGGR
jgi:hypothetical protein